MPRSSHGMTPKIITAKARKKMPSTIFWRPVSGAPASVLVPPAARKRASFSAFWEYTSDLLGSALTRAA